MMTDSIIMERVADAAAEFEALTSARISHVTVMNIVVVVGVGAHARPSRCGILRAAA